MIVQLPLKIRWEDTKMKKRATENNNQTCKPIGSTKRNSSDMGNQRTQGTEYSYSLPIIEEPDRAITQLRNLARGAALIRGRNYVTVEDIPLIIKVVLSTASIERVRILDLLLNAGGRLSTSQIEFSLNISKPTAKRTMAEFKGLGIVDLIEGENENSENNNTIKTEDFLGF